MRRGGTCEGKRRAGNSESIRRVAARAPAGLRVLPSESNPGPWSSAMPVRTMMSRCPRSRWLGWAALCVVVLYWVYNYPVYRLPTDREVVREVLRHERAWRRNGTAIGILRKLLEDCCEPRKMFAVTKENSPMGKVLWYDGEFYYSHTVNNDTYSLFVKETPLRSPLKRCAVVGNGGILKHSDCGWEIDLSDFVMRCNLPPLSKEYTDDVGTRTHLVTANPSIIEKRDHREFITDAASSNGLKRGETGTQVHRSNSSSHGPRNTTTSIINERP